MGYICIECGKVYNTPTNNHICDDPMCPGEGLTGILIEQQQSSQANGTSMSSNGGKASLGGQESNFVKEPTQAQPAGLCILLMDASGSMGYSAFDSPPMEKRKLVANAAARGVFDLVNMTQKDNAYICAIRFDHSQHVMFVKTVAQIIQEFNSASSFADYLYNELRSMNGGTNINAALKMAGSFVEKFLNGTVPGMENRLPMYHSQFSPILNKTIDIPNVRILIYTDGEQYSNLGPIRNPISHFEPDLLMGAFIGQTLEKGCGELRNAITKCPIHGTDQFFILDRPEKITTLKGLFRMASGTTGFCPDCLSSTMVPNYD